MQTLQWAKLVVPGLIAIGALGAFSSPAKRTGDPPCVLARKWVAAHRSSLPRTRAQLSKLPVEYRKAVYRDLKPGERESLWRENIDVVLSRPDLTPAQRAFLLEVRRDLAYYLAPATSSQVRRDVGAQAKQVLGIETARAALARLGDAPQRSGDEPPICECGTDDDWCSIGMYCADAQGPRCGVQDWGCGWFLMSACNGMCTL